MSGRYGDGINSRYWCCVTIGQFSRELFVPRANPLKIVHKV